MNCISTEKSIWHHGGQVSGVIAIQCEVLKAKLEY